jgi:hypothetical protein
VSTGKFFWRFVSCCHSKLIIMTDIAKPPLAMVQPRGKTAAVEVYLFLYRSRCPLLVVSYKLSFKCLPGKREGEEERVT